MVRVRARVGIRVQSGECTPRVGAVVAVDKLVAAGVLRAAGGQSYGLRSRKELELGFGLRFRGMISISPRPGLI